jgi:hypothetical protein
MATKTEAAQNPPAPLEHMQAHALELAGNDAERAAQVKQFFKEMGPVIRKLWDASFDDESWAEVDARRAAHTTPDAP